MTLSLSRFGTKSALRARENRRSAMTEVAGLAGPGLLEEPQCGRATRRGQSAIDSVRPASGSGFRLSKRRVRF